MVLGSLFSILLLCLIEARRGNYILSNSSTKPPSWMVAMTLAKHDVTANQDIYRMMAA